MKSFLLNIILFLAVFFFLAQGIFAIPMIDSVDININPPINNPANTSADPNSEGAEDQAKQLEKVLTNVKNCGDIGQICCSGQVTTPEAKEPGFLSKMPIIGQFFKSVAILDKKGKDELQTMVGNERWCQSGIASNPENNHSTCVCLKDEIKLKDFCSGLSSSGEKLSCEKCSNHGVWSALGCIDFTLQDFIKNTLLSWGIGLAGVMTLLCIIYSAFIMQISGGNPEKLKKAKERLTACIVGLLLIIFSVFILKIIGIDILQIPLITTP